MDLTVTEATVLFDKMSGKAGQPPDGIGLDAVAEKIGGTITGRFLSDKYRELQKGGNTVVFRESKLVEILKFLGFDSMTAFRTYLRHPISSILKSCEGVWVNYVRQNSFLGVIYASPVRIYPSGHKMHFDLQGATHFYTGEISLINGCLFTLFSSPAGKQFHHIYKIGSRQSPLVLQGIHSGVSTSNDPIGGRTLLIRSDKPFEAIINQALETQDLANSVAKLDRALATYFKAFKENNLRIKPVITYELEDLF